jgi:predicted small integral membrane protein
LKEAIVENIAWMAWTPITAAFFAALALLLATMTWVARTSPEVERVGILGIPTTRGDRLFLSLVLAALIHLVWIGVVGVEPIATVPVGEGVELSSLWIATAISLVAAVIIFRTV